MASPSEQDKAYTISRTAIPGLNNHAFRGNALAEFFLEDICKKKVGEKVPAIYNPDGNIPPEDSIRREIHFRAMDIVMRALIEQGRAKTIVEFAAGLSTRGFDLTRDYDVTYIETDISKEFDLKQKSCERFAREHGITPRGKHYLHNVNAITQEGMEQVMAHLEPGEPIIIVNAGFITYHPRAKRVQFIEDLVVDKLMRSAPGSLWVTPDFGWLHTDYFTEAMRISPSYARHMVNVLAKFKRDLGVDLDRDGYPTKREMYAHFDKLGLKVDEFGQPELGFEVQSEKLLQLDGQAHNEFMNLVRDNIKIFVFQLADSYRPVLIKSGTKL